MKSAAISVGTTPTVIVGPDDLNRWIYMYNAGGDKVYLGGSDVTTANGYQLESNAGNQIFLPMKETIFGIVQTGTHTVTILTPNSD